MFEEFTRELKERIQEDADNNKKGVDYLVELIGQNLVVFQMAFDPLGEISCEKLPVELYSTLKALLCTLDNKYTKPFGITIVYGEAKNKYFPAIELEYAKFESNHLRLTEKGKRVINNYRKIRGYMSLDEEIIRNREMIK